MSVELNFSENSIWDCIGAAELEASTWALIFSAMKNDSVTTMLVKMVATLAFSSISTYELANIKNIKFPIADKLSRERNSEARFYGFVIGML